MGLLARDYNQASLDGEVTSENCQQTVTHIVGVAKAAFGLIDPDVLPKFVHGLHKKVHTKDG